MTITQALRLNLGCGTNFREGYVNVDKYGAPDVVCDLEKFPWPWEDNSVEEIRLDSILEHLGQNNETFLNVMKELYRICKPEAIISIVAPHPRHMNFINDPTHVRAITVAGMHLFSKKKNLEWQAQRAANSPYALHLGVDFEVIKEAFVLEEPWKNAFETGKLSREQLAVAVQQHNNVVRDIVIVLKAIK
jgi:hypothetical protein